MKVKDWRPLREGAVKALKTAVERAGSNTALAASLKVANQQVHAWGLPADNKTARPITDNAAIQIEQLYGVPAEDLQPHRAEYWIFIKSVGAKSAKADKSAKATKVGE